jgi:hypothetical protein
MKLMPIFEKFSVVVVPSWFPCVGLIVIYKSVIPAGIAGIQFT